MDCDYCLEKMPKDDQVWTWHVPEKVSGTVHVKCLVELKRLFPGEYQTAEEAGRTDI